MTQSVAEILFDASYLILITIVGILILSKAKENSFRIYGIMALTLVLGDSFHLVPRIFALATDGLAGFKSTGKIKIKTLFLPIQNLL